MMSRKPESVWAILTLRVSSLVCLSLLALIALTGTMAGRSVQTQQRLPPLLNEGAPSAIPGQYIVVFQPGTNRDFVQAAQNTVKRLGGTVGFTYTSALIGFSATLSPAAVQALRAERGVAWIEADQKVSIDTVQTNPSKGLDRTSERLLSLDQRYTYSETGTGVHAYVIDTGIRTTHVDFGGRASGAFTAIGDGHGTDDCHGHGTHVAGTIGGLTYGIAKQVTLHAVRVLDCGGSGTVAGVVAGVDWVTNNAVHPAVANMSLTGGVSPTLDLSVTNSIASGVTYVVAAGNFNADACNFSPARVPTAITVGAIDPVNDTRASFSNWGTCLDLFAPGVGIVSAWNTNNTATNTLQGTSMAAPHVAGVASLYLQNNSSASPASVWNYIHTFADDLHPGTPGWAGIINPGPGSPDELLHWGSLSSGVTDGDPHITTVDGSRYDFQGAGEFVTLRDAGVEIQIRQTPVVTTFNPGPNPHTGLATCVSLNTAVAARVGQHRVTFQPNLSGVPDPSGLQLRVDGVVTTLAANGLNLGPGARVLSSLGGGIRIEFPEETILIVTPMWWASQSKWYLNVSILHTRATEGIMGAIAPGNWLPALPKGAQMGPMPVALHQRYVDLYQTFADAWRVTNRTSLFDYAPGTSTATFTFRGWPQEGGQCVIPETPPVKPAEPRLAQEACRGIVDKNMNAGCVFDVTVTGEPGFAKLYLLTQQIRAGATRTILDVDKDRTQVEAPVRFTATVTKTSEGGKDIPHGMVQFTLNDERVGVPVRLDPNGRATWKTMSLKAGEHRIAASFIPDRGSVFLESSSIDRRHIVTLK